MSHLTDIRPLPLKILLVYLEIEQIIKPIYTYFEDYPFKLIESAKQIVDRFKGERREFVQAIFAHGATAKVWTRPAKVWTRPDTTAIVTATGSPRRRVLAALDYFDQQGWVELAPKGSVEVFEILNKGFDLEHTTDKLFARFSARERFEVVRIGRMITLFEAPTCLAVALSAYFGEILDHPCGKCSQCGATRPIKLPQSKVFELSRFDFNAMAQPLLKLMDTPVAAAMLTRFLCGISTPKPVRIRARKLTGFGSLAGYPYQQVCTWAASHLQSSAHQPQGEPQRSD